MSMDSINARHFAPYHSHGRPRTDLCPPLRARCASYVSHSVILHQPVAESRQKSLQCPDCSVRIAFLGAHTHDTMGLKDDD